MNAAGSINVGNSALVLIYASLVTLMTPGLAFFCGALVGRKERLNGDNSELHVVELDHRPLVHLLIFDVLWPEPRRRRRRSHTLRLSARAWSRRRCSLGTMRESRSSYT